MGKREGKVQFDALRRQVTTVLREEDPIGLIHGGAPPDEYDPEIGTILPRLKEAGSVVDLRRIIHEEFSRWFGVESAAPEERYGRAAERIWPAIQGLRVV
jgi:hypothetical protein